MSKIKRKPITPNDEPPELPKRNSTLTHSLSYSSSISSDMDIRPSLPVRSSTSAKVSPTKPDDTKRLNSFLHTPKRLFPGDHIRDRTKNPDDAASVDSSKSTREDTANKIKSAFNELENLKRKNEELEKKLSKYEEIKSDKKESNIKQIWSEIEEMTNTMMKELKIDGTKELTEKTLMEKQPMEGELSKESKESKQTAESKAITKQEVWVKPKKIQESTETLDVQDPDLSSQFHSDILKMMSSFGF
ncbi:hypothetical protein HDV01_001772 [Terramyces sp. JEL0728]|nr:hypothetical protein HDV01_001772 [Terramyces sp. JEL0728]